MKHSKEFIETIITMYDSIYETHKNLEKQFSKYAKKGDIKKLNEIRKKDGQNFIDFALSIITQYQIEK